MTQAEVALLELKEMHVTIRECSSTLREIAQNANSSALKAEIDTLASYTSGVATELDGKIAKLRVTMAGLDDASDANSASLQEWKRTLSSLVFELAKLMAYWTLLLRGGRED